MVRIVRSPLAKRDIADVLRFTVERWGKAQARVYRQLIVDALGAIAADPTCAARHLVFYRVTAAGVVEIIRFLHDAMDFDRHL